MAVSSGNNPQRLSLLGNKVIRKVIRCFWAVCPWCVSLPHGATVPPAVGNELSSSVL